ncbi:hypothetical protein [Phenylobacterium sp.]|uniref:hypothetical protein n=1 Tax=Phenylobacterium sp. TaxID=1871053 RepID=UPI0030F4A616
MPAYTFFPYLTGGSSLTFEAIELSDDDAAKKKGLQILAEHGSATEVEIWRDDRLIHRQPRTCGDAAA